MENTNIITMNCSSCNSDLKVDSSCENLRVSCTCGITLIKKGNKFTWLAKASSSQLEKDYVDIKPIMNELSDQFFGIKDLNEEKQQGIHKAILANTDIKLKIK